MVNGSPSLKGPTGCEFDSCLPRSPRIRGVDGGTKIENIFYFLAKDICNNFALELIEPEQSCRNIWAKNDNLVRLHNAYNILK